MGEDEKTIDIPLPDWCSDNQLNIVSALARIDAKAEKPDPSDPRTR